MQFNFMIFLPYSHVACGKYKLRENDGSGNFKIPKKKTFFLFYTPKALENAWDTRHAA